MRGFSWVFVWLAVWAAPGLWAQGEVEKLPPVINSDLYDETAPVISADGQWLFFTRTGYPDFDHTLIGEQGPVPGLDSEDLFLSRLAEIYSQIAGREVPDARASTYNQDIWIAPLEGAAGAGPLHPGYPLNSALPNSLLSRGMHPDEYIVINQFFEDGSMYTGFSRVTVRPDGTSSFPSPMHVYDFSVVRSDVNMTMTPDGHVLLISMDGPVSFGENDLYVSFFVRDNVWSSPVNIGRALNSPYREISPHLSTDKRFLYFASDRPGGAGGHDIYVTERLDYTWMRWTPPTLMEGLVNTAADESQPFFDPQQRYMYFTSRRDGSSDLFRLHLQPSPRLRRPIHVRGRILSKADGQPVRGELFWGPQSTDGYLEYFNSYNGEFELTLTEYEVYKFETRKTGHDGQQLLLDAALLDSQGKDTIDLVIYVEPRTRPVVLQADEAGGAVSFYNIQFVRSEAAILARSFPALEDLVAKMNQHPTMEILIEGHTDNVGDEGALINLSVQRAEAVKRYLTKSGITASRIRTMGYGATRPRYDNQQEQGRAANRRVEIRITQN